MNWSYKTYKEKYKQMKREKDFLKIECDDKDLIIKKQNKLIEKLEKENYELICLLSVKIKEVK